MKDKIRNSGLLALSPLAVFLGIYLVSSLIAKDFYKIPIAAAFLIASASTRILIIVFLPCILFGALVHYIMTELLSPYCAKRSCRCFLFFVKSGAAPYGTFLQ